MIISYFLQYVVRIIILNLIKLACNCLINCILQDMILVLVKFNISIFAKGVPFLFQAGWKGKTGRLAWKKGTPFCKIEIFKSHYFVVFRNFKGCFRLILRPLEKYVVGCPSFIKHFIKHIRASFYIFYIRAETLIFSLI